MTSSESWSRSRGRIATGAEHGSLMPMDFRPIKTWSYPGALLDALVDTRRVVADLEIPLPSGREASARELRERMLSQLDSHLIPRVREQASPAIVVVGGPTGAGKSTVVNALLGEQLTAAGVLRPTTKIPHLFHNPLDVSVLQEVALKASVYATEAVPRGLALVDSPDLDSVRDQNRAVAGELLESADLWIFVTTPARYGDAIPWNALRQAKQRGASVAIVLNRATPDVAGPVRRDLIDRLAQEGLEGLPFFVVPETDHAGVPRDVVSGLGRWLDEVASASASMIVERTLHGGVEAMKDWLEDLAIYVDEQAAAAKEVRAVVRRCAAKAELETGSEWFAELARGPLEARWATASAPKAPLFHLANSLWVKRRAAREERDAALRLIKVDLVAATEAGLAAAAARATDLMMEALHGMGSGVGPWLIEQRDPRDARVARERRAADAARTWIDACTTLALEVPGAQGGKAVVGDDGLGVVLACAALGLEQARGAIAVLTRDASASAISRAREELEAARHYVVQREALDLMKPTDIVSLGPDASAKVRLRRAELRALQ